MSGKDDQFSFVKSQTEDRDPTVRDVHRLELEHTDDRKKPASFNPYDHGDGKARPPRASATTRTDLRKLSEWMKLRQQVESRRKEESAQPDHVPTVRMPRPKF